MVGLGTIQFTPPLNTSFTFYTTISMKEIPTTFEKYGYTFTLHSKRGLVAIYEQRKGNTVRYEVVKLTRAKKDYEPYGVKAGDIMLPSTNQWGHAGWTYITLEAAEEKAYELIKQQ